MRTPKSFTRDLGVNARTALGKFDEFAPDLLLTDLKMPGIDGIDLLRNAHERDPDCVMVVMTAFSAVDTAVRAMREGAADYLTKPINVDELKLVLERAVGAMRSATR